MRKARRLSIRRDNPLQTLLILYNYLILRFDAARLQPIN